MTSDGIPTYTRAAASPVHVLFHGRTWPRGHTRDFDDSRAAADAIYAKTNEATAVLVTLPTDGSWLRFCDLMTEHYAKRVEAAALLTQSIAEVWSDRLTIQTNDGGWRVMLRRDLATIEVQQPQQPKAGGRP